MAKLHQDPIDLDKQIENLLSLGLIVNDKVYAKELLKRISYYRVIKAYSITLKENGRYREGTTFEDIVNLYLFDMGLRHALFPLIEHIEISLRAAIANFFSLKYGNFGYENIDYYEKKKNQERVLCELRKEIKRNKRSPFISNFLEHYEEKKYLYMQR